MLRPVIRSNEMVTVGEKILLNSPTSYSEIAHLAPAEDVTDELDDIDEYKGPTADDLRREAELFKSQWEEEKERMISSVKNEAENIIKDAQNAAFAEVKRKTDEAQVIKEQAEEEAERILADAQLKAAEIENEMRKTVAAERKEALNKGMEEGHETGYAEGKAEVERLIERTQIVLERAQDKRGEILSETEKEIIDLVLLISRKVIKVLSENQRNVIISNVIQALRKVKAKGNVIIRVNMVDLKLATEHKQDFINLMEGAKSVQLVEDSSVDSGGCIIETDFGEIDARISSQLAELESRILEISPMRSSIKDNIPVPVVRTANLNADLGATSSLMEYADAQAASDAKAIKYAQEQEDDSEFQEALSPAASAALTASAALAALATMGTKGRRDTDKKMIIT